MSGGSDAMRIFTGVVLMLFLLAGCTGRGADSAALPTTLPPPEEIPVLRSALAACAESGAGRFLQPQGERNHIVVHHLTCDGDVMPGRRVPPDVRTDLRRRNATVARLSRSDLAGGRVLIYEPTSLANDDRELANPFPTAFAYAVPWRPGFSRDGNSAVVQLWLLHVEGGHTSYATYGLVRQSREWRVAWRDVGHPH